MANSSVFPMEDKDIVIDEDKALNDSSNEHTVDNRPQTAEFEVMECPICLQICVHPSKLPCGHIFCFLCVKGLKNRRCAMCRTEFPLEFLERPQLLIPIASSSTSHSEQNKYQWFYKGRNGWWQYDERTCQEIEDAYKNDQKQCTILVAGYVYIVDFDHMLQQRQSDPLRKRQVKRDLATISKKGVAGIRLWCTDDSTQNGDGAENTNSNSNFISTIAATERVIRIASDIIDSTLAHADDQNEQRNDASGQQISVSSEGINNLNDGMDAEQEDDGLNGSQLSTSSSSSNSSNFNSSSNRRDMLDEIEETFNITNLSSINNSFRSTQLDDFFSLTLDEFRNLTMSNIADDSSSSDENNDDEDNTVNFNESNSEPLKR